MYQRRARPMAERWQTHSGGQPQRRCLGLWTRSTRLMCAAKSTPRFRQSPKYLPELEAVRGALPPCGDAVRLRFLPSAVGFVVGPELERAQVVRYRASEPWFTARSVCPRLAAPRTVSRSGGSVRGPCRCIDVFLRRRSHLATRLSVGERDTGLRSSLRSRLAGNATR